MVQKKSKKNEAAEDNAIEPCPSSKDGSACHWVIDPPNGPVSSGKCKKCGESKEFKNSVEIDFKFIKNNKSISAGHNGKAIKGKFIRFVVENKLEKIDEIIEFKQDGFAWDGKHFVKNI